METLRVLHRSFDSHMPKKLVREVSTPNGFKLGCTGSDPAPPSNTL